MVGRACVGAGVFVCTYTVTMCMNVWLCKHACFHHIYMFFCVFACTHVLGGPSCVCVEAKVANLGLSFGTRLLGQRLWRIACSAPFPHWWYSLSSFLSDTHPPAPTLTENTHTETPCILFYPVVAHSLYRTYCFQRENSVHLKERRWKRFNDL